MSKTSLRVALLGSCLLGLAVFASGAQARGFGGFHGGGFHGGHGIAVGEPHPGGNPGGMGHHHHGGWGGWHGGWGYGWRTVGYPAYDDGCTVRRTLDPFGRIVWRRFCD